MTAQDLIFGRQRQYQQLTLPVLSLIVILLLTFLVLIPQIMQAINDFQGIRNSKQKIAVLSEKAILLASLDTAELKIRSQKLTATVPSDEDLGYFLVAIRSLVWRTGLLFQGVELLGKADVEPSYAKGVAKAAQKRVPVKPEQDMTRMAVLLQGNLSSLQEFLQTIEKSIPLVSLEEFVFSREQEGANLMARVTLRFYFSPIPATLGITEQPLQVITAAEEQIYNRLVDFQEPETVELPRVPTGNQNLMM